MSKKKYTLSKKSTQKITLSLAFINKNRILSLGVEETFYIFCEIMETWDLTQTAIKILEWSWDITEVIWNPFTSAEWFFNTILDNSFRFRTALIIFLLRLSVLIWTIKDASARSSSFWFQLLSVFLIVGFTPIIWLLLYIAIRPQWWKWDKTPWRDALYQNTQICEECWEFNHINNLYCTKCGEPLYTICHECQNKFSGNYDYCPNCGAPSLEE